ncbi:MAG: hypothetical protein E7287_07085 [Lachnospiraceae bacterium]|nr:hypothetical protein [Lachnospiraceae bacterium]
MAKVLCAEIGHSVMKICEMEYKAKNPKVYRCFEIPIPEGSCVDGYFNPDRQKKLVATVKKGLAKNRVRTKKIIFTVFSGKIINREVLLPAVRINAIDSVIQTNISDYFPVDMSDYNVTYTLTNTIEKGKDAGKHKVLIMAAENAMVQQYRDFAESLGLTLINLCYGGDSIYRAVKQDVSEDCRAIVTIEEQHTIITIVKEGKLLLQRSINYGVGEAVSEILNQSCFDVLSYEKAWNLAKEYNCFYRTSEDAPNLLEGKRAVEGILKSLAGSIARIIDYFNSHADGKVVQELVLAGSGAGFVGLDAMIAEETERECSLLSVVSSVRHRSNKETLSTFVTCIGAGLSTIGFAYDERKEKEKRKNNYIPATVLLVIFFGVAIAAMAINALTPYREAQDEKQALLKEIANYGKAETLYYEYVNTDALFKELALADSYTKHTNDALLNFLEELEKKLPKDAIVYEFSSDDSQAVITMQVTDKEKAAGVIDTLRGFESLMNVSVSSILEEWLEDSEGNYVSERPVIRFTVICKYYPLYEKAEE